MNEEHPRDEFVRRIVVVLDPSAEGASALEFAADLAAALGISLAGVFVEDLDISEFAELPFAREVSLSGAGVRDLSRQRMQSFYRAAAERARRALETLGRSHRIHCSFEWRRGRLTTELSAAAREWDVIVISSAAGHVVQPRGHDLIGPLEACCAAGFLAFTRPVTTAAAGVLTVFTGSDESQRAVALSARIASQQHTTLTVVAVGGTDAHAEETIQRLASGVARLKVVTNRRGLTEPVRLLAPTPRLVVLPADLEPADRDSVRALGIPTLIIRATRRTGAAKTEQHS